MSGLVVTFLAIGGFALLLLVLSLIGGHLHLGHLHLGDVHFHTGHGHVHFGHPDGGTELSLPVIAGFLGAFGFGGAIAATLAGGHGALALMVALVVGVLAAVPTAFLAGQQIKFNARAAQPLALGTQVFVIEVPSPTSVLVEPTPSVQ